MMDVTRRRAWLYLGRGLLIWVGFIALTAVVAEFVFGDNALTQLKVNVKPPDFELKNLHGDTVRLSERRDRPVILNFWATWCAPCVLEMPKIQKYFEKYPGEFDVLAVNAGEARFDVERFVEDMGLTFEILLDPGGKIQELYQIRGYPTSFFVDANGIIRVQHLGPLSEDQLTDYLLQVGVGP